MLLLTLSWNNTAVSAELLMEIIFFVYVPKDNYASQNLSIDGCFDMRACLYCGAYSMCGGLCNMRIESIRQSYSL